MKSLIVIDDRPLKKAAFREAEKMLKKLDRLEQDCASFFEEDQKLFSSWYDLTFRQEREAIQSLHEEYEKMARFHNDLIAIGQMRQIPLPEAWAFFRAETERYENGDLLERAQIELDRRDREEFLRKAMAREMDSDFDINFDDEDDFDAADGDRDQASDSGMQRDPRDEAELRAFREMPDKKLAHFCRDRDQVFEILSLVLDSARNAEDFALFLRVWELVPSKHQISFGRAFQDETGVSIKRLLKEMHEVIEAAKFDDASDEEEPDLNDHFIRAKSGTEPTESAAQNEALKSLYRTLIRALHPDLQTEKTQQEEWQKKIWNRVQTAYAKLDFQELKRLSDIVQIRHRELQNLSISDVADCQKSLRAEIESVNREIRDFKSLPAWGFSRRKDYGALKRKIQKSLQSEFDQIREKVLELKSQHELVEFLSKTSASRQRKKARTAKKKKNSRTHRARPKSRSTSQSSFFDSED